MSRLLLIRHGRTKLHKDNRFWGNTDVPLSETGIRQAGQLRERLAAEKISAVYASTLSRALTTAEIIAAPHRRSVTTCPELRECNFGYIEGLTYPEIKRVYPALARELNDGTAVSFPGGENIEQLNKRVATFTQRLADHKAKDTIAIVAHGGPLRLLICSLLGLEQKHWIQLRIDLAALSIVETYPGTAILNLLNDTSFLTPEED
ncbi:MAG: histidine phosphatase family protein [Dehalococcoidales bacterium]|jgi:alpha-ribazole phosphatase